MDPIEHLLHKHAAMAPHGACWLWDRGLMTLHLGADAFIALSYYSIPLSLLYLISRRKDLIFNWVFVLFACFIFACGTTHVMNMVTVFRPYYWTEGWIKFATAGVSFVTAVLLLPVIPKSLQLPNPTELQEANAALAEKINELNEAQTQLKRYAAELERSNGELTQFAHVASHDLQEPLRMVSSYMQLIERRYKEKLEPDGAEFVRLAADGATRMQHLINDILAYSRVSAAEKPFEMVDLEQTFASAAHNLQLTLAEKNGELTHDPLPRVPGDGAQLLQVLQNLIGNGLKFHGSRPPRVHVRAEEMETEWRICVRDEGIGLDMKYAEQIFMIFRRLHGKRDYVGTGIGLAIVKKIIDRHGGKIWVESAPGQGAKFVFTLPKRPATATGKDERAGVKEG